MKTTEKTIQKNILNQLYNLILSISNNENINDVELLKEELTNIFLKNNQIIKENTPPEKNRIILSSLKNANTKNDITQKLNIYKNNTIEIITDSFYMIYAKRGTFKNLNLKENAENEKIFDRFFKTKKQIEALPIKIEFSISNLLYNFCYCDVVKIENGKNFVYLEKKNFLNYIAGMDYKNTDFITIYGESEARPFYSISKAGDRIGLLLPIKCW